MCNIKQQAIQRLEPQDRSKKPSVNRAVRLPADLQVKMNEVVEICDLLMMDEGLSKSFNEKRRHEQMFTLNPRRIFNCYIKS